MTKKKRQLEIPPELEAKLVAALRHGLRAAREAYADFEAMTPEEYQAQKADAEKERRRPKPPARPPSRHTDADILNLERQCVRKFQVLRGREPRQREIHAFISSATGLEPSTCRDRLLKARKNKG